MPSPTVDNGFKLFNVSDMVRFPYFKVATDFYTDSCWAERPAVSGSEGVERWLAENAERVFLMFRRATQDWAIHGRGVVVVHQDGTLVNVDPPNYFRLGEIWEPDEVVKHVICYRYHDPGRVDLIPSQYKVLNRIRVIKYAPAEGVNTVQTFLYHGWRIGVALDEERPAGIQELCTFGLDDSFYGDIQDLMSRFIIQLTNNHATLNRAQNSIITLPTSALNTYSDDTDIQTRIQSLRDAVRPIIGLPQGETITPSRLEMATEYPNQQQHLEYLAHLISLVTKVPPTSFGIGLGKGESGIARERSQDAAAARIRDIRDRIARCLPRVITALGAPQGEYSFTWNTSPFEDRVAKQRQLLELLNAGVISIEEARAALGYATMEQNTTQEDEI